MPGCTLPGNREDLAVLRVVVRHGISGEPARLFLDGLRRVTGRLTRQTLLAHL